MDRRCPNCNQPVLADDAVCWQCGSVLVEASHAANVRDSWPDGNGQLQLSPRLFYGGLTLFLVVAALVLTAYLGRQPRLQAARTDLPPGWAWFRNSQNDFTLFLPPEWGLLETGTENQQAAMNQLVEADATLSASYFPLSLLDDDLQTIVYAAGPMPGRPGADGHLLAGRSRALNQLSPADLLSVAAAGAGELGITLEEAREAGDGDRSHIVLAVLMDTAVGLRRCQQRLYPGVEELLLITACAAPEEPHQQTLSAILDSFQRLSR